MKLSEMEDAIGEAEIIQRRADMCATKMAKLLVGRLRSVQSGWLYDTLNELKKELKDYNAHTNTWKS